MTPAAKQTQQTSTATKLVVVMSVLIGIRFLVLSLKRSPGLGMPSSGPLFCGLCFASFLLALVAATLAKKWFGSLVAFLLAVVFGGLGTLLSNMGAIPGAVIGVIVGWFVISPTTWKHTKGLTRFVFPRALVVLVASFVPGFIFGFTGLATHQFVRMMPIPVVVFPIVFCSIVFVIMVLWKSLGSDFKSNKRRFVLPVMLGNIVLMSLFIAASWVFGLEISNQWRLTKINNQHVSSYVSFEQPIEGLLRYGISTPNHVWFHEGSKDDEMAVLCYFPNLHSLSINSDQITNKGILQLSGHNQFTSVYINDGNVMNSGRVTDKALSAFSNSLGIEFLWLSNLPITDKGIRALGAKPRLSYLSMEDTHITGESLRRISNFRRIRYLNLSGTKIDDQSLKHLSPLRLDTLKIARTSIHGCGLLHLMQMPLSHLDFSHTKLDADHLVALTGMRSLSNIDLAGIAMTQKSVNWLNSLPKLQTLDLKESGISDELALQLPPVEHLSIDGKFVSAKSIHRLTKLQTEITIHLKGHRLSREDVYRLSEMSLEIICEDCIVDANTVDAICNAENGYLFRFSAPKGDRESLAKLNNFLTNFQQ